MPAAVRDGWTGLFGSRPIWIAVLALSAVVRIGVVLHAALDPDESQHLHAAWLVAQGQVPFVDFWEHHLPTLYYLLAPLTRGFAERPAVYAAGRATMAMAGGVALLLVYRLARRISRPTAMAAVLLLAFLSRFVEHTTEIRPDPPALVAWLGALLALVIWAEGGRPVWLWGAGLALGTAVAFTPKTLYAVAGVIATVGWARGPRGRDARDLAGALGRLGAGATLPLVALLGWLWLHGGAPALRGLVTDVVWGNLHFADFTKSTPVPEESVGVLVLAVAGIALTVWREGRAVLGHAVHGPLLWGLASISLVLMLPITPAVYRHAWLPVLPIFAIYAGIALVTLTARAQATSRPGPRVLLVLALVAGLGVPAAWQLRNALHDANHGQLELMRRELLETCPGEPILDGTALAVFRPAAYRYEVLVTGIREWIAKGALPEERIQGDAARTRARVAVLDPRLRGLIGPVARFLHTYYVAGPDGLWLLGARIPVGDAQAGGHAEVVLLRSDFYRLSMPPGAAVTIDGTAVRVGFLRLRQGRHDVRWTGVTGEIRLTVAGCPERRALRGVLHDGRQAGPRRAVDRFGRAPGGGPRHAGA